MVDPRSLPGLKHCAVVAGRASPVLGEARARVARACRREARRLTRCVEGET